ncbi:MAG: ATP-binding protein, partial [candidate division WOR-3 bacterium]
ANKKILEMGGLTKKQIGQHISSYPVFSKEDINIILQKMQARLAGKVVKPYEVKIHRADGKELTVEISAEILKDTNGKPFADVAFVHDVTERKQFETALMQAKESAEEANKAKTAFLHNMSHELRSPLTSIVGFTNLLLEKEADKEKKEMLEIIKNSSNYLLKIINDLLQLSKIEAGKITIDKKEFNLYDLANTIYKRYSIQAQNKGLKFKLTIPPNLPALIIADNTKIEQIINNLIDNAIKFTLQGEIELNINIKKESKTKQPILEFYIKDTGIGIEKERINQIFDRFVQGEFYISKKYGGAGLGLPIIKELITIMKGSISVQSTIGKGTKFTIQIPIKISKH